MALVNKMASDISGVEGAEADFVTLVIRDHPKLDEAKALDVLPDEIAGLKSAGDLVRLEVRRPDTTSYEIIVPLAAFSKIVTDEALAKARSLKGRRPGTRINGH